MRQVNRLARQARAALRRPPRLRWAIRLRRLALVLVGLGAIGAAADLLWRSPAVARLGHEVTAGLTRLSAEAGFVVTRIYSEGRQETDERSLRKALEPYYGRPILGVDLNTIKSHLGSLPWVRAASVSRRLPDTLWIRIEEHRPAARWLDGNNRQWLVSDAGEVLRVRDLQGFRRLPLLRGKGAPARAGEFVRLVAAEPSLAGRVSEARLIGGRRWNVQLDGRIEVRLPEERPETAWRRLAAEQRASAVLGRAITAIDLRHPDWLTVQLADETAKPKEPGA